jgi:hypothetical protein
VLCARSRRCGLTSTALLWVSSARTDPMGTHSLKGPPGSGWHFELEHVACPEFDPSRGRLAAFFGYRGSRIRRPPRLLRSRRDAPGGQTPTAQTVRPIRRTPGPPWVGRDGGRLVSACVATYEGSQNRRDSGCRSRHPDSEVGHAPTVRRWLPPFASAGRTVVSRRGSDPRRVEVVQFRVLPNIGEVGVSE